MFGYIILFSSFHCFIYLNTPSLGGAWGGFHFPIRDAFPHVVIPFLPCEIALYVLTQTLGNLWQRDKILCDGAVLLARPDVVLVSAEDEVGEPTARLEQRDGLYLLFAGHPEEQFPVVTG